MIIGRRGPIGVVELAGHVGRDYTTVSRQVAKLASLGLVSRQPGQADRRVHEAVVTGPGGEVTAALDAARERMIGRLFAHWEERDIADLVRLMRRFVDDLVEPAADVDQPSGSTSSRPAPD